MLYMSVLIPREFSTEIMSNFLQAKTSSFKVYDFTYYFFLHVVGFIIVPHMYILDKNNNFI